VGNSIKGILLIDRGVPEDLNRESLIQYYQANLKDNFYTSGPRWLQKFIINYLIIPWNLNYWFTKYRRFWSSKGFIGRFEMNQSIDILQRLLSQSAPKNQWIVEIASLYGDKPIDSVLLRMKTSGVQELLIIPLFPQWSEASRGILELKLKNLFTESWLKKSTILPPFYENSDVISAQSELLMKSLPKHIDESVSIISAFRNEIIKTTSINSLQVCRKCLTSDSECRPDLITKGYCYRFQCYDSAKKINEKSELLYWDVAFYPTQAQARFNKNLNPSLKAVTDHLLEQGVTTMIVQCPSIVYSEIETINDIGVELREYFLDNGGLKFVLVPSLGRSIHWLSILQKMILEQFDHNFSIPHNLNINADRQIGLDNYRFTVVQ